MKKILIADKIDLTHVNKLQKKYFTIKTEFGISNEKILKSYNDFEILIIRSIRNLDANFINKCNFKIIATVSRGTDHINVNSAKKKNIKIIHCKNGNADSVAEFTIGSILSLSKNILLSDSLVRKNKFTDYNFKRTELKNKTLGIIGFGEIGSRVGKVCKALGMKIIVYDKDSKVKLKNKNFKFVTLNFLLRNSDFVTIHIPLEKNINFLNEEKISILKSGISLINTSRGEVINETALIKKLKTGEIHSAALDVFKNEPKINQEFLKLKNVILTNHIAGKTPEAAQKMSFEIINQLQKLRNH
ncbi:MAG TPA: NAD(P)-dependent oxidoreductase [Ignavibacteria bacterium]|nr:NAD(P)-dependent oxidoreductase [Ignavibacteria bacterium]